MPLRPTQVMDFTQPALRGADGSSYPNNAAGALAQTLAGIKSQRDADQEAQDKEDQRQQDYERRLQIELIGKMDQGTLGAYVAANKAAHPELANVVIPDNAESMAQQNLQEIIRRGNDSFKNKGDLSDLAPPQQLVYLHAHGINGGETWGKILGVQAYSGTVPAQQAAETMADRLMSPYQTAEVGEKNRHNVVEESQTGPERDASRQSHLQTAATARAHEEEIRGGADINSPWTQTDIAKSKAIAQGKADVKASTGNDEESPQERIKRYQVYADKAIHSAAEAKSMGRDNSSLIAEASAWNSKAEAIRRNASAATSNAAAPTQPTPPVPTSQSAPALVSMRHPATPPVNPTPTMPAPQKTPMPTPSAPIPAAPQTTRPVAATQPVAKKTIPASVYDEAVQNYGAQSVAAKYVRGQ